MALPDRDTLFARYLLPWYSEQDRDRRVFPATRPDMEQLECPAGLLASDLSPLVLESQPDAALRVADMLEAAAVDWKELLNVEGAPSIGWIAEFDRHFHRRRIQQLIRRSDPTQYDNDYLVLCCELGAVLGTALQSLEPRLSWLYDWPYWESALYCTRTRLRVNVFHWALTRLSECGVEENLVAKLEACASNLA